MSLFDGMDAPPLEEVHGALARKRIGIRASSLVSEIRAKSTAPTVTTEWPRFNLATDGLEIGTLSLFVGYQGSGKSSFASQLGAHHAKHGPVIYYLGEMAARHLVARVVGQLLGRSWRDVLRGKVGDDEMMAALAARHLYIVPRSDNPIAAIAAALDEAAADGVTGTPLVVVDYVQLLADPRARDYRTANVAAMRDLQGLIESRELVGVVLSQTSRGNSKRMRDGTQNSVDLADTGAESSELERAAALVGVLSYQQEDDAKYHDVTMAIAKRRFGGPTKLYFRYYGETGLWEESGAIVRPKVELDLETAILEQVRIHRDKKCLGGNTSCWRDLSGNTLSQSGGCHRVGSKENVNPALKRMVATKQLVKLGNDYVLPDDPRLKPEPPPAPRSPVTPAVQAELDKLRAAEAVIAPVFSKIVPGETALQTLKSRTGSGR